jgi:hypothetical protein
MNRRRETEKLRVPPAEQATDRMWLREPFALLVIAAATCFAYWPALWGEPIWDDDAHITRFELRPLCGLDRIWFDVDVAKQIEQWLNGR